MQNVYFVSGVRCDAVNDRMYGLTRISPTVGDTAVVFKSRLFSQYRTRYSRDVCRPRHVTVTADDVTWSKMSDVPGDFTWM